MRYLMQRPLAQTATPDPDPRANPGDVPFEAVLRLKDFLEGTDTVPTRLLLSLEGVTADNVTVQVWAQDDQDFGAVAGQRPTQAEKAARTFYNATPTAGVVVTVGQLVEFPAATDDVMPGPGNTYLRVSALSLTGDAVLKVGPAQ